MDTPTLRILDASINRAGEGLRVVEDYARFVLDDPGLTANAKGLRHDLTTVTSVLPPDDRAATRDTINDVGQTDIKLNEPYRQDGHDVATAGIKRAQQAFRTIEEYGKLFDRKFAAQVERLRYRSYTLEKALAVATSSIKRLADARLYLLIDGGNEDDDPDDFEDDARSLAEAGVHALQLRDKGLSDRWLVARAHQLVEATRGKCLAIINDRPDIAAATHADGVHLGQDDMSVKEARAVLGPRAIIGVSTHSIEQARRAVLEGANYLGAGPTFPSTTKSFDEFPGLDYLRQVSAEVSLPTFAIGGINADNLPEVLSTGVSRVAVSSAVDTNDYNAARKTIWRLLKLLDKPSNPADG